MNDRPLGTAVAALLTAVLVACSTAAPPGGSAPAGSLPVTASAGGSDPSARPTRESTPEPSLAPGVTAVFHPPFQASGILVDGDLIWAEDHARTGKIYGVDPDSGEVVHIVDTRRPCDLAALDGQIWFADVDTGKVAAVDPNTGKIVHEISGLAGPCGVQAGDGVLWAAVDTGLARIDPSDDTVTVEALGEAAFPGSGDPRWAALYDSKALVLFDDAGKEARRVDPPGGVTFDLPLANAFGSLWAGNGDMYRLDPKTGNVQAKIESGGASRIIATDDSIWFTNYPAGSVGRIDASTNKLVYRIHLGGNPNGIAYGFGSIWVADTQRGELYRLDPQAEGVPG